MIGKINFIGDIEQDRGTSYYYVDVLVSEDEVNNSNLKEGDEVMLVKNDKKGSN